ncbi:MAG TPA: SRPBCC family protein [Jatrophihabitans sp.]|nr:SRPBCC family protein [Jatrophihabitans sp.]
MAQSDRRSTNENNGAGGTVDGLRSIASKNPATEQLLKSLEDYLAAKSERLVGSVGDKVKDTTKKLTDVATGDAEPKSLLGNTAKRVVEGDTSGKAVVKGAFDGITNKVKGLFGKGKGPSGRKSVNIEEQIDIGVPVRQAYNRWTQFTEFSKWAKGVQSVNQKDEVESSWNAKIFWSKRNWNAKITEQVPDERIVWKSDGPKGTVDGIVTFHELAPNLTRVLLALEYHPAGLFEKTGNLWRAQGRRARLDLKLYRRFVMMSDEEVDGWRGEIRDGEVARDHDEVTAEEQDETGSEGYDEDGAEDEYESDEGDDEYEEDDEYEDADGDDDADTEDEDERPARRSRRRASSR